MRAPSSVGRSEVFGARSAVHPANGPRSTRGAKARVIGAGRRRVRGMGTPRGGGLEEARPAPKRERRPYWVWDPIGLQST